MVEKQLLKLSRSSPISSEYEIKNVTGTIIDDALVVTLYNLAPMSGKNKAGMPSLL